VEFEFRSSPGTSARGPSSPFFSFHSAPRGPGPAPSVLGSRAVTGTPRSSSDRARVKAGESGDPRLALAPRVHSVSRVDSFSSSFRFGGFAPEEHGRLRVSELSFSSREPLSSQGFPLSARRAIDPWGEPFSPGGLGAPSPRERPAAAPEPSASSSSRQRGASKGSPSARSRSRGGGERGVVKSSPRKPKGPGVAYLPLPPLQLLFEMASAKNNATSQRASQQLSLTPPGSLSPDTLIRPLLGQPIAPASPSTTDATPLLPSSRV
jgi:hypothetical protein